MRLPIVSRLTDALVTAGFPIMGVLDNGDGTFTLSFTGGATQLQQTQANAFVLTYVDNPRRPRSIAAILTDLQALTTAQQNKIIAICCAYIIQQNPDFAAKVNVVLSGDQPDV